jgi:cysteine desulfurase
VSDDIIYLDYAAATPVDEHVLEAMQPYYADLFYNPSSPYKQAVAVRRDYESAKQRLAVIFGAKGDELIMTAGATESVNLAFHGISKHIVTSSIEHPAVIESAKQHEYTLIDPDEKGRVSPESIKSALTPETELVSIGLANSELGTVQPLRKIAAVIEEERQKRAEQGNATPLLFHSDASQGFGHINIHVARLGVDMLTLNAAKIYGPKQVGLLWRKPSAQLTPTIVGGGQEQGFRSGTENVPGVIGFAAAAEIAAKSRSSESARLADLRNTLETRLVEAFPQAVVTGSKKHRLPGHLHIAFPGIDAERIIFMLENEGVMVATGSACSANKHTASHVLKALQLPDELINGSLRLTLGRNTSEADIETASYLIIQSIENEYRRLKDMA